MSDPYEQLVSAPPKVAREALRALLAGLLVDPDRVSPGYVKEFRALLAEQAGDVDPGIDALEALFAQVGDPSQPR